MSIELVVLPTRPLRVQMDVVRVLEKALEEAKSGMLLSVCVVATSRNGTMYTGHAMTSDKFALAGALLSEANALVAPKGVP